MDAKVPQNIDMEDKLFGPLTLVQFLYLLFGGMAIYLFNSWTQGSPFRIFFYPLALVVGLFACALAFVKIQQRPFIFFLISLVKYLSRPRMMTWHKADRAKMVKIVEKEEEKQDYHKTIDPRRVSEVAQILDQPRNNPMNPTRGPINGR